MECPLCHKEMLLKHTDESSNSQDGMLYKRMTFVCEKDDVWMTQEIPQRKEIQIIVFSGVLIKDGKILLNLRSESELPDAHMKWELPGGKAEFGESPEGAVAREFEEETGRKIKVVSLLPKVRVSYWDYSWGTQQTFCLVYLCELIKDGVAPKDHHVERCEWVKIDEVKQENSLPGMIEILEMAKNMNVITAKTGI